MLTYLYVCCFLVEGARSSNISGMPFSLDGNFSEYLSLSLFEPHPVMGRRNSIFLQLEPDLLIPGNMLAIMGQSIVTVLPDKSVRYLVAAAGDLRNEYDQEDVILLDGNWVISSMLQSIKQNSSDGELQALVYFSLTYKHCILVLDRTANMVKNLSTPCSALNRRLSPDPNITSLEDKVFRWPKGLAAKDDIGNELTRFYVASTFDKYIYEVDISTETVLGFDCCTTTATGDRACYRPHYLTLLDGLNLIITINFGLMEFNIRDNTSMLLIDPQRHDSGILVDGSFDTARVSFPGPLAAVPKRNGVYVFADQNSYCLRLMERNSAMLYSLCKHYEARLNSNQPSPDRSETPECNFFLPSSVAFGDLGANIYVGRGNGITMGKIKYSQSHLPVPNPNITMDRQRLGNDVSRQIFEIAVEETQSNICKKMSRPVSEICAELCIVSETWNCNTIHGLPAYNHRVALITHKTCLREDDPLSTQGCLAMINASNYGHMQGSNYKVQTTIKKNCVEATYSCPLFNAFSKDGGKLFDYDTLQLNDLATMRCKVSLLPILIIQALIVIIGSLIICVIVKCRKRCDVARIGVQILKRLEGNRCIERH